MPFNRLVLPVIALLTSFVLASCASIGGAKSHVTGSGGGVLEISAESYEAKKASSGTILLSAMWGRVRGCGKFENAQLVSFAFDRKSSRTRGDEDMPDVELATTSKLLVDKIYDPVALQIPPGEYVLSGFKIKVAKSVSDVGYFTATRSLLLKDGPEGAGTFKVAAGETAYIGHFSLDCAVSPILWRYYLFPDDLKASTTYKKKYPYLDMSSVSYRPLSTKNFGGPIIAEKK